MRTKHPELDWRVEDVRCLGLPANYFDLAIDKVIIWHGPILEHE